MRRREEQHDKSRNANDHTTSASGSLVVLTAPPCFSRSGWYHLVGYVLYENAMSVVRISAMWSGLLELSDAHEWVVTSKLGNWAAAKAKAATARQLTHHLPLACLDMRSLCCLLLLLHNSVLTGPDPVPQATVGAAVAKACPQQVVNAATKRKCVPFPTLYP